MTKGRVRLKRKDAVTQHTCVIELKTCKTGWKTNKPRGENGKWAVGRKDKKRTR